MSVDPEDTIVVIESVNSTKRQPLVHRPRQIWGLTLQDGLKFIGSLLLPLLLAVFTVIITFDQRNENRIQRAEDLRSSREQREQDLNNSALQREQDRNISALQRAHDKEIAEEKREADDLNALKQRNMSQTQRDHELAIEKDRYDRERDKYLDGLVLTYVNEIGLLLDKHNGILTSNAAIAAIARSKSLNVISQLDAKRNIQLVHFLFDTGQLSKTDEHEPLDLWGAQLNGINWSKLIRPLEIHNLNLMGAYLNNASFTYQEGENCYFYGCHLREANFTGCVFSEIDFESAILVEADFSFCDLRQTNFLHTDVDRAVFYKTNMTEIKAKSSRFRGADFRGGCWNNVEFEDIDFTDTVFYQAVMFDGSFTYCYFTRANMTGANLSKSYFDGSQFVNATLVNANFDEASLEWVNLADANLTGAYNLTDEQLHSVLSLQNTILPNGTIGRDVPFISNGDAHCNRSIFMDWQIDYGNVEIRKDPGNPTNCRFSLIGNTQMSQRVKVFKYWELISSLRLKFDLRVDLLESAHVKCLQLGVGNEILSEHLLKTDDRQLTAYFNSRAFYLNISVQFQSINRDGQANSLWDNLTLTLDVVLYEALYTD